LNYDWITFDCYGTLIDWETGIAAAFEKVARAAGHSFDRPRILALYKQQEMREEFGYSKYTEVLVRVAHKVCVELGWKLSDYGFIADSLPRWRPFPDTNPALERLSKRFKLGILSNIDNNLLDLTRRHFTIPFQLIVTAEQVRSYKPEPGHFREARKKIGTAKWLHAAQSFYHDVVPCSRLAIDVAWINRNQETPMDPKIVPLHVARDLTGFANWVEGTEADRI
jgi:2-haloalkanoic acid dehalogenase type II